MSDFKQASNIAMGETINKLIRDNITLGNMLTCIQETIEEARKNYNTIHSQLLEAENKILKQRNEIKLETVETLVKVQEDLYERIKHCKKLVKINRRLQRQITEEECKLKEKNEDFKNLTKILDNTEQKFNSVTKMFAAMQKEVVQLEFSIFEVALKVKEAIEIEVR
ncbi:hypothetical protein Phum_PHUM012420 [Pediculus humanus corporis]|uniref:Uncharacterized protein n=1 Tax=Pediculus humanus subsp. corporis TaxID=121224 RepID=E0V9H8_PEDHC|nr:uncharacterized protein Phum_PHUM012420 [Pediculus humanus corporis]EEB10034.1 hypothetical protein Phum_PHUM012420 [Pediculus humanus corporis]